MNYSVKSRSVYLCTGTRAHRSRTRDAAVSSRGDRGGSEPDGNVINVQNDGGSGFFAGVCECISRVRNLQGSGEKHPPTLRDRFGLFP